MSMLTSEKQTLSDALIKSIDSNQFSVLSDQRKEALTGFKNLGLPGSKSEEYRFTPITKLLEKNFSAEELAQSPALSSENLGDLIPKDFKDNCIVFVNGRYDKSLSRINVDSKIVVKRLAEAIETHSEIVLNRITQIDHLNDPFAFLNSALWQDGLFIHVPKNTVEKNPLFLYHLHDTSKEKVVTHSRVLAVIEQNAEFTLVEKGDSKGDHPIFNTINEEISVGENATFNYYKIQNDPGQIIQVANTTVYQHASSRANTYTFTLNGSLIRNNLNIVIDGEGCESHFYGLYLTNGDTLVDNHTTVDHKKPNSFSNELYKGLMDGKSKGVFNGKIFVRPHAQKTNAFQSNRNILLSDSATVNTKPQLEIWADDVKCSHGCTSGQLDDEALFYLQSRGIPRATAKAMLLYAFAAEVLEAVPDQRLSAYIDSMISDRLHKSF
ncbi:MAG: Fe-S cluster assembly protein SufD [Cyclobacteriaceae bacterium]